MTTENYSCCVVIPVFDQHAELPRITAELQQMGLACLLVDDGSGLATKQCVDALACESVEVMHLPINQGKGAAVIVGLKRAAERAFTHVVQIDADGQHRVNDVKTLIAKSKEQTECVIAGARAYASMPKGRSRGRRFTDLWVHINTLSSQIADSMCGLRVYPLQSTLKLLERTSVGHRMEFDTDIAVHLYWSGVDFVNVPVAVTYPADNTSHFRMYADNTRISIMHAKHFLRMLVKLPAWLVGRGRGG